MSPFLDGTRLNGPHVARISTWPARSAFGLKYGDLNAFRSFVEIGCQLWGGAADVAVPLNASGEFLPFIARFCRDLRSTMCTVRNTTQSSH